MAGSKENRKRKADGISKTGKAKKEKYEDMNAEKQEKPHHLAPEPSPNPACSVCGVDLGADCPRQVCGRRGFCDNDWSLPRKIDFNYKFLPW